jgi:serine/threonine protein kinase
MSTERHEGWLLAGRYRLLTRLGQGGMGTVWRAHDEFLDREVAVKQVTVSEPPGPGRDVQIERAMREARIAGRVSHPNIATVYDMVLANERPWIVMEFIPSRTLAQMIDRQGALPVLTVARIALDVLAALRAAHAEAIVHRDVKPANILLTPGGQAILTDFGLATTLEDEGRLTQTGLVVGTPAYIAPERTGGGPSTPRADLWSLGATLYTAVEGRSPFGLSAGLASLSAVLNADLAPFERAGPLGPVISGLLVKDPGQRIDAAEADLRLRHVVALFDRSPGIGVTPATVASAEGLSRSDTRGSSSARALPAPSPPRPGRAARPAGPSRWFTLYWRQAAVLSLLVATVTASVWSTVPRAPVRDDAAAPTPHAIGTEMTEALRSPTMSSRQRVTRSEHRERAETAPPSTAPTHQAASATPKATAAIPEAAIARPEQGQPARVKHKNVKASHPQGNAKGHQKNH